MQLFQTVQLFQETRSHLCIVILVKVGLRDNKVRGTTEARGPACVMIVNDTVVSTDSSQGQIMKTYMKQMQ